MADIPKPHTHRANAPARWQTQSFIFVARIGAYNFIHTSPRADRLRCRRAGPRATSRAALRAAAPMAAPQHAATPQPAATAGAAGAAQTGPALCRTGAPPYAPGPMGPHRTTPCRAARDLAGPRRTASDTAYFPLTRNRIASWTARRVTPCAGVPCMLRVRARFEPCALDPCCEDVVNVSRRTRLPGVYILHCGYATRFTVCTR